MKSKNADWRMPDRRFAPPLVTKVTTIRPSRTNKRADSGDNNKWKLAERTGLEPATPGVTGRYSNQLNYRSRFNDRCAATAMKTANANKQRYVGISGHRMNSPNQGDSIRETVTKDLVGVEGLEPPTPSM
jgi:hypothetical protein